MIHHTNMRLIAFVLLFAFCQVIRTMCALPDLSMVSDEVELAVDMNHMSCPMDGTMMCPPSAISSPERQLKYAAAIDFDQEPLLVRTIAILGAVSIPTPWSWSSVSSIVPISIASSSVLRI